MCRNIRLLNAAPAATEKEIREAAMQYVRKISGITSPRAAAQEAFKQAVDQVASASSTLLTALDAVSTHKKREPEHGITGNEDYARRPRQTGNL
jgi:hypothetical protein